MSTDNDTVSVSEVACASNVVEAFALSNISEAADAADGTLDLSTPNNTSYASMNYPTDGRTLYDDERDRKPNSFAGIRACWAADVVIWSLTRLGIGQLRCDYDAIAQAAKADMHARDDLYLSLVASIQMPWYRHTDEELRKARALAREFEQRQLRLDLNRSDDLIILQMWQKITDVCPSAHVKYCTITSCDCGDQINHAAQTLRLMVWSKDVGESLRDQLDAVFRARPGSTTCDTCDKEVNKTMQVVHMPPYISIGNVPMASVPRMDELVKITFQTGAKEAEKEDAYYRVKCLVNAETEATCTSTIRGEGGKVFVFDTVSKKGLWGITTEQEEESRLRYTSEGKNEVYGNEFNTTVVVLVRVELAEIEFAKTDGDGADWVAVERRKEQAVRDVVPFHC